VSASQSYRLVIADDHPLFRGALRLSISGLLDEVEIAEAGTFDDAVALLERSGSDIDLVLLDLSMPRVNGLEAAQQIRRNSPDLRVIIFSELNGLSLADECRRYGADGFVPKNVLPEGLLAEIQRLFSSGAQRYVGPNLD